jgi:peptidoglycan/LPS O-acetylase OafA/YrhL
MERLMVPTRARQYELDWLRVLAVLAVFVQHIFTFYSLGRGAPDWSPLAKWAVFVMADSRMPLMFFVAGASCMIALGQKSLDHYARERARKLLLPMLVGLALLVPPLLLAAAWADGTLATQGVLRAGSPLRPDGSMEWGHLWFLLHIILATIVLLPLVLWLRRIGPRVTGWYAGSPRALVLLGALPLAAYCVRNAWVAPLGVSHLVDLKHLGINVSFVACGAVVAAMPGYGVAASRCRRPMLGAWIGFTVVRLALVGVDAPWAGYATVCVSAAASWVWVLCAYGYARQYLHRGSPRLNRLSVASYAFYLVHVPVIVVCAALIAPWPLPSGVGHLLLAAITFPICVAICELAQQSDVTRYALGLRDRRQTVRPVPARTAVLASVAVYRSPSGAAEVGTLVAPATRER